MRDTPTALTRILLKRFTAFESLDLSLSPGINAFLGANGTGKTHLMKVAYAACDATKPGVRFTDKLARLFLPSNRRIGRMVKRRRGRSQARIEVWWPDTIFRSSFSSLVKSPESIRPQRRNLWLRETPLSSVYIPVKEMLANAPGFRSLYSSRSIHFEEVYSDILDRAFLPPLLGAPDLPRRELHRQMERGVSRVSALSTLRGRRPGIVTRRRRARNQEATCHVALDIRRNAGRNPHPPGTPAPAPGRPG